MERDSQKVKQFSWLKLRALIGGKNREHSFFSELISRRFTFMIIPHDESKPITFQINALLLAATIIGVGLILTLFIVISTVYSGSEQRSVESRSQLSSTQSNLDTVLEEVNELTKVHEVFQGTLSTTLGELDLENSGSNRASGASGDASQITDLEEISSQEVREIMDIKRLSKALSAAISPLGQIGEVLKTQKQILSDIPSLWPVVGASTITMEFGPNIHPITRAWYIHKGIDIAGPLGLPILAAANGKVIDASYDTVSGYGLNVTIEHKYGFRTRYCHMSNFWIETGQVVKQGQRIGSLGSSGISTGPHTHFELQIGTQVLDPTSFLKIRSSFNRWEGNR